MDTVREDVATALFKILDQLDATPRQRSMAAGEFQKFWFRYDEAKRQGDIARLLEGR